LTVPNLEVEDGVLQGNASFRSPRPSLWEGGTLGGFGTTTLQAGATLAISRSTVKTLAGRTLNTLGTTTGSATAKIDLSSGATWNNAGTFTIQTDKVPFKGHWTATVSSITPAR